ncbi:MAG: glycosyltransferase [Pseudomonadota bacterium]
MRITFLVTHLLGTGHLARALTLARAAAEAGHDARVISGGRPAPALIAQGVTLVPLPPVASDGINFTRLLDENGTPVADDYMEARRLALAAAIEDAASDVLVTELYPFGRRVLKAEFLTALNRTKAAGRGARIYASVRDILAPPSDPRKAAETEAVLAAFYDKVLVHSDPAVTPLDASWPVTPVLADRLIYTGFVTPPAAPLHPESAGAGEIIVTAGGGPVGGALFEAALAAAKILPLPWRLLVGGSDAAARIAAMQTKAPRNVTIEGLRPDFRQMLHHASVSVSMCGYNTALDLLQTGVPAVLIPFDAGGEAEQGLRARALAARRRQFRVLAAGETTGATLAQAVADQSAVPRQTNDAAFDGATRTVAVLEGRL